MKTQRKRARLNDTRGVKHDRRVGLVHLNVPLSVKADTIDTGARTFEGLAATWDEDLGQDVIHRGAFKSSITNWKSSGEAMPLLNSHDHYDIFAALGQAVAMKETPDGLWAKWEVIEGADGDMVLSRLRPSPTTGRAIIGKMSIGFLPTKYTYEQPAGTESYFDRIRHITEAELREVSLVLFPMNPNASIDAGTVKMWLKMAHDQDPKCLDPLTRRELRRLNSKIGLLLSKGQQKAEDDDDLSEEEDEQDEPPTPRTNADSGDSTDDSDEGDAQDDDTDDTESTDSEDTDDTDDSASRIPTPRTPKAAKPIGEVKDKGKTDETPEPKPYVFSEALSQRLQSVTLKHKTAAITERGK